MAAVPTAAAREHELLDDFARLMDREEALLAARDADGLLVVAEERDRLTAALLAAAGVRRAAGGCAPVDEVRLADGYRAMRARHETRARVVRRFGEHNARALGVLAQAAGQTPLYGADGRVAMSYAAG